MPLNEIKVASILKDLNRLAPPLKARIKEAIKHAKFLRSCEGLDAREVLNIAKDLHKEVNEHANVVRRLTAGVESLSRKSDGAMKGQIANIKSLREDLGNGLDELHDELLKLAKSANARLNEPGRYGDAATAAVPVNDLMNLFFNVIDLVTKYRKKAK